MARRQVLLKTLVCSVGFERFIKVPVRVGLAWDGGALYMRLLCIIRVITTALVCGFVFCAAAFITRCYVKQLWVLFFGLCFCSVWLEQLFGFGFLPPGISIKRKNRTNVLRVWWLQKL